MSAPPPMVFASYAPYRSGLTEHGLVGKADVIEFHPHGPLPVEYKIGRVNTEHAAVQLCAQAICLEEMLDVPVATRSPLLTLHQTQGTSRNRRSTT